MRNDIKKFNDAKSNVKKEIEEGMSEKENAANNASAKQEA